MERMEEEIKVFKDTSQVMEAIKMKSKKPTGLIIDESAHLKKGIKSVAVGRQYAGVVGKVDNCQVGVYASLVNDHRAGLVNERLFIPKNWVNGKASCKLAGIPEEYIKFKTKPQLAMEMIDEMVNEGVEFDWVGGDEGYFSSLIFTKMKQYLLSGLASLFHQKAKKEVGHPKNQSLTKHH